MLSLTQILLLSLTVLIVHGAGKLRIDVFIDTSVAQNFDNSIQLPPPPIPPKTERLANMEES